MEDGCILLTNEEKLSDCGRITFAVNIGLGKRLQMKRQGTFWKSKL
jgi:hypothetical protein